ncbi:FxsA family protein [Nocardioides houyundeii]|uniref:FxsA family protein n=1 Tax=Nocardioides houyundeii TaxID=2045452 RepID=UPI000C75C35F|nr:FxsA family protein [Nocardioides houyundeii]
MTSRRGIPMWVLFVLLVVMPLAEIWVLIQVGQTIGAWWTIVLLVLDSFLGGWVIRREGARAWRALNATLAAGRMPSRELADGALIIAGGTLMLSPGFVSDAFGILLILPITRPVARRLLTRFFAARLLSATVIGSVGQTRGSNASNAPHPGPGPDGPVVRGEVVDP